MPKKNHYKNWLSWFPSISGNKKLTQASGLWKIFGNTLVIKDVFGRVLWRCYLCSEAVGKSNTCEATDPWTFTGLLNLEGTVYTTGVGLCDGS